MNKITFYELPSGRQPVTEYLNTCHPKVREKIVAAIVRLEALGPTAGPHTKKIVTEQNLFELRISHQQGISRIIYFTLTSSHLVLLHAFTKKTQKTPRREIEVAKRRMKEHLELYHGST
ncbi:type II toxin-antitoxin system RelE/ParE family toxin [bacterium]|nr:type II toxin-antitoxin system RelE/ParE family toxin [bacterium]